MISYYIHTEIYAPKSIQIKIVSSRQRSQLIGHTIFFTSEKRRIHALIGYIIIFTTEQNHIARSPLLLIDKKHISKSLGAFSSRKTTSNQTNRFQSLADSSTEECIDGHESENAKKKTKHNVSLFHEFLALKGETKAEQGIRTRNTSLTSVELFRHIFRMSYFILTSSAF